MELKLKGTNLVIGLASRYTHKDLLPFIKSLKKTGFQGDIVWFVSDLDKRTLHILEREGVVCIPYKNEHPYFEKDCPLSFTADDSGQKFRPNNLRFIFYKAFLDLYGHLYEKILHADTRDVFFQKNLFATNWDNGVYCFLEDDSQTIKSEKYNSGWIRRGFGEKVLEEIGDNTISCCGVVYGASTYFKNYINTMVEWLMKIPQETGVFDQGIHNYLIYTSKIEGLLLIADDAGEVTTLTSFKPFDKIRFDPEARIINKKGEVISVVHQYDRHLRLMWRFNKHLFFKTLKNKTKRKILVATGRKFD